MRQYQQKNTHTHKVQLWIEVPEVPKPTKQWQTTQTYLTNTSWIFRVQVIDCFMRFWGLSRLKFSMHFVFAACNWPTTSLASDTVCLCNLPRTCWGPNIRIPTIMLRTWEKIQHSREISENRRNFYPSKKKTKPFFPSVSGHIPTLMTEVNRQALWQWRRHIDVLGIQNKILRNWRNMKEYMKEQLKKNDSISILFIANKYWY